MSEILGSFRYSNKLPLSNKHSASTVIVTLHDFRRLLWYVTHRR